jgi:hypothetical protein
MDRNDLHIMNAYFIILGHAIAQAVNHWLPTAAAWVRCQVWSREICGEQSGTAPLGTSVSPANSHSTDCCTLITYHPGLVQ